jgi:hypothetical protein
MTDPIVLAYAPTVSIDYKDRSGYSAMKRVNDTLAVDRDETGATTRIFVHGNIRLFVRSGGADLSRHFGVRRVWRAWTAGLDPGPPASRIGDYQKFHYVARFRVDSGPNKPFGHWWDSPGLPQGIRLATSTRLLFEWVVACEEEKNNKRVLVPGVDGLYFFMLLDYTPSVYRISYSPIWPMTPAQVNDVTNRGLAGPIPLNRPFKWEADVQSSDWVESHSDWVSYQAHNDQLPLTNE